MPTVPVNVKLQGSVLERIGQVRRALDDIVRQARFTGGKVQLDISFAQTSLLFMEELAREVEELRKKAEGEHERESDLSVCADGLDPDGLLLGAEQSTGAPAAD